MGDKGPGVGAGAGAGAGEGAGVGAGAGAGVRTSCAGYVLWTASNCTAAPLAFVTCRQLAAPLVRAVGGSAMSFHPADTDDLLAIAVPSAGRVFQLTVVVVHAQDERRTLIASGDEAVA